MSKKEMIQSIRAIIAHKEKQIKKFEEENREHIIDYAIIEEEIKDAKYVLQASEKEEEEFLQALHAVVGHTTSASIYDAIGPYLSEASIGFVYHEAKV